MKIEYAVDNIHEELGKEVMARRALDKACDQLQAEIKKLRDRIAELEAPKEAVDGE
jgi:uncharacterized coiled-coil DUF342 family protein